MSVYVLSVSIPGCNCCAGRIPALREISAELNASPTMLDVSVWYEFESRELANAAAESVKELVPDCDTEVWEDSPPNTLRLVQGSGRSTDAEKNAQLEAALESLSEVLAKRDPAPAAQEPASDGPEPS